MSHIFRSFALFLFFMFSCFLFRLVFLLLHFDFSVSDMFESIFGGLRYDSQFCAGFASFYCLFGWLRKKLAKYIYILLSLLLIIPELVFFVFFNIYHKKIDSDMFLFKHESMSALLITAVKENYGVISAFVLFFVIVAIFMAIYHLIEKINLNKRNLYINAIAFMIFALSMLVVINQQFSYRARSILPLMPSFDHYVLNVATFGHVVNFYSAIKEEYKANKINFDNFNVGSPKKAACEFFDISDCNKSIDLYQYIQRTKTSTKQIKPRKIYYIISESLSNWILEDRFKDIFPQIHNFVATKATYIPAIHNAPGTIRSLEAQFLGVQIDNYEIFKNYAKIKSYKQSLVHSLSDMGYGVSFYFGGSNNWARTQDAGSKIGMSNFYYQNDVLKKYPNATVGAWGVLDNHLFDFLYASSKDNFMHIVMTTTVHGPYDMLFLSNEPTLYDEAKAFGFNPKLDKELTTIKWYQKTLVEWIEKTAKAEPDSLFVITGDHYGRYNVDDSGDLFTTHSIPVIFYSPMAKIYPTCKITSHLDIAASIINLIAPKGYEYASFGSACFSLEPQEITNDDKIGYDIEYQNGQFIQGGRKMQLAKALSWYLLFKGNIIE